MPRISSYPTKSTPLSNDLTLIADASDSNVTKKAALGTIVTASSISPGTPTSAGTAGVAGELQWDATYIYICTVTGTAGNATWERTAALTPV